MEVLNKQEIAKPDIPTLKQFRAKFKEIFDAETTFGSSKAARLELLEGVLDIVHEYIEHGCSIVYLHGKLKEAGYTGSRKELSEWLVSKELWAKREASGKKQVNGEMQAPENSNPVSTVEKNLIKNKAENLQSDTPLNDSEEKASNNNTQPLSTDSNQKNAVSSVENASAQNPRPSVAVIANRKDSQQK